MLNMKFRVNDSIAQLEKKIAIAAKLLVENEMSRLKASLEEATPVDTGLAKASWRVVAEGSDRYRIINDTPYIEFLNAGSSKQAPAFFVEKTALKYGKPKGMLVIYK